MTQLKIKEYFIFLLGLEGNWIKNIPLNKYEKLQFSLGSDVLIVIKVVPIIKNVKISIYI